MAKAHVIDLARSIPPTVLVPDASIPNTIALYMLHYTGASPHIHTSVFQQHISLAPHLSFVTMILTQISYLDCIAFLIFLTPQLLIHVGLLDTAACGLKALPFLLVQMPFQFIWERYLTPRSRKSPFVQRATPFQDIVIRCVRYAFADIPASIGKVFFSEGVALPFFYFRMWRHGIFNCPIPWVEIDRPGLKGLWIISDETKVPDVVVYYCHGESFFLFLPAAKHHFFPARSHKTNPDPQAADSQWAPHTSTSSSCWRG